VLLQGVHPENARSLQPARTLVRTRARLTAVGMTTLGRTREKRGRHEIVSPGFIVISSVFTPRAFSSFWKASGVPVSSGNVA